MEDSVAFGDGCNDYDLLKKAGKGFVMGNAFYRLKESLPENETVESNVDNGVAKKLVELFL